MTYDNQKKQKNIVEERLLNKGFQSKNNNKSKDLFNEFIPTKQNMFKKPLVERNERESKNIFKISDIKKGEALIITNNLVNNKLSVLITHIEDYKKHFN